MAQPEGFAEMLASVKEKVEEKVRQRLIELADRWRRLKKKLITESENNKCIKGSNHGLLRKIQIGKIAADSLSTNENEHGLQI